MVPPPRYDLNNFPILAGSDERDGGAAGQESGEKRTALLSLLQRGDGRRDGKMPAGLCWTGKVETMRVTVVRQ